MIPGFKARLGQEIRTLLDQTEGQETDDSDDSFDSKGEAKSAKSGEESPKEADA